MIKHIERFIEYYRVSLVETLGLFSDDKINGFASMIKNVIKSGAKVYAFGNGGSNAIARHLILSLRKICRDENYGIRANTGIDFETSQQIALAYGYQHIFSQLLKDEKANLQDLVVLISGSGNSDNLIEAINYCNTQNIPNISFSGFDGGKIAQISQKSIIARINDQQISEDIIQALLHLCIVKMESRKEYIEKLDKGLRRISADTLNKISEAIVAAYLNQNSVYVLAPEGNGLSISAEHTAHNLNWDSVYGIENPPIRIIYSTPTNNDYSGIGNDRMAQSIVTIQQLEKAKKGDKLLLFLQDTEKQAVKNVMVYARDKGIDIYAISGIGNADILFEINDEFVTADLMQITGHIIGRIVNCKLKQTLGYEVDEKYLIDNDLAQRRLIGEKNGL